MIEAAAPDPARPRLYPARFNFRIKLKDEDGFFPVSAFARTEDLAKAALQERFNGQIEVFRLWTLPKV